MPCHTSADGNLTICTPTVIATKVKYLFCPKCNCKRRVTIRHEEWYGWSGNCTAQRLKWAHFEKCGYRWEWD